MSGDLSNPFGEMGNLISGPIGQYGASQVKNMIPFDKYSGMQGKIFNEELRGYFNVSTQLVMRKLIKLLLPFKRFDWEQFDQIKKLQLYIPILSFITLILFSTIVEGITTEHFEPKMGKKALWIVIFTFIEIILAKCSENTISNLNISFLELGSLVSYRFVPLALLTVILTVTSMSVPYLNWIGLVYLLFSDTYFCKIELNNYANDLFKQEGLGSKIALAVHFVTTLAISWMCDLL